VASVIEDFIFYRPAEAGDDAAGSGMSEILAERAAGGVPLVLYVPSNLLKPGTPQPVAPMNVENIDRSSPGLHLNIVTVRTDIM
jgi:hypothetical protein